MANTPTATNLTWDVKTLDIPAGLGEPDHGPWTAVVAPISCDYFSIKNMSTDPVYFDSSNDSGDVEDNVIYPGEVFGITSPRSHGGSGFRFMTGQTVVYVRMSGTMAGKVRAVFLL